MNEQQWLGQCSPGWADRDLSTHVEPAFCLQRRGADRGGEPCSHIPQSGVQITFHAAIHPEYRCPWRCSSIVGLTSNGPGPSPGSSSLPTASERLFCHPRGNQGVWVLY